MKIALAGSSTANNINDKPTNNNMGTTGTDVVFMLDTTGSMSGYINRAKEFIRNYSSKITENNGRVGLVLYRDLGDEYTAKKVSDLQSDTSHILQQLNVASVGGGGDTPEAVLHASMTAMNTMNWKQGATKAIILLTDAPAHHPDRVDNSTVDSVAKRSLEIDPVNIYPVVEERLAGGYKELAEKTSGQVIVNRGEGETITALNNALTKIKNRPNAKLKIGAYYSQVGRELTFDASDSYVVNGEIIKYEWDFDGDGTIDKITDQPVVNHVYNEKFDGHMQVRMWADNDTVSNISVPVKIGIESSDPVSPAAPAVTTKVINKNNTKATVILSWGAADSLVEKWIIRQGDDNLGWVIGGQNQLEVRDVDLSEAREYSVVGVTKDGLVGEAGSVMVEAVSTTPDSDGSVSTEKVCPYKFQVGKLFVTCHHKKITIWNISWYWVFWRIEWIG